jgi:hypothetical protein
MCWFYKGAMKGTVSSFPILLAAIGLLHFGAGLADAQSIPFAISMAYPTNGQIYTAPANIGVHARVADSNVVQTVQYFSGATSIGIVSNTSALLLTNLNQGNPFFLSWTNVTAGVYALTAVATDTTGIMATSVPVTVIVSNVPPPVLHPAVYIYSPTNGAMYLAPANLTLYARAAESGGTVQTVQFFAGSTSLGIVSNSSVVTNVSVEPLFPLGWSNVLAGNYALKAVATDVLGNSSTSSVVNISVVTNFPPPPPVPFVVGFWYPTNGQKFIAPANVGVHARVTDSNLVTTVQYFSGATSIGMVSNTTGVILTNSTQGNPFFLDWSNVPPGDYPLTAVATDSAGLMATSPPVIIHVLTNPPPPNVPFLVYLWYPTNGQTYIAPATIAVHATVVDSNVVSTVQYFSGFTSIGIVTNGSGVLLTNTSQANPFLLLWSNVPPGNYTLTAVATDHAGLMATSPPVTIHVLTNIPPPPVPFVVSFWYPTNDQMFVAPANIGLHARVTDSNLVTAVKYFSGSTSIGVVTNPSGVLLTNSTQANPFFLLWSNVPPGNYTLTAVAFDSAGLMATSSPVNIHVLTNPPPPPIPFVVGFWYPTNGQVFIASANIGVHARVTDSNLVTTVQYFSGTTSIGIVTNSSGVLLTNSAQANPFFMLWSNVPAGNYRLTAVAMDLAGVMATSPPVYIYVVSNLPPAVNIYATDPVAIEGTNYYNWFSPGTWVTNYIGGTNTATFLVRRDGGTNADLTVHYTIGGTASNGVDYAALPGSVTIPAGQRYALITVLPLNDSDSTYRLYDTVLLGLIMPTNTPPAYMLGPSPRAGAVILEENFLPMLHPVIHAMADGSVHVSLPANNGLNFTLQISTDLMNWVSMCTNTVLKGSAQFVDPNAAGASNLYYRIVPANTAPTY